MRKINLALHGSVNPQLHPCSAASFRWLSGNDLYSNRGGKDYQAGDIITIVISEESNAV